MISYFAKAAFLPDGWAENVLISINDEGLISSVETGRNCGPAKALDGFIVPGMPNLHSHAFQRAMAGLAERATDHRTDDGDSFWTWREVMYRFLENLTDEDQQAIAAQLYVDMLKAGYTSVGEFHYVHHKPDGTPYSDRARTSRTVIDAAKETGIAITLLPVLYAHGSFGGKKASDHQRRFLNDGSEILAIVSSLSRTHQGDCQVSIGLALHSLRAVSFELITDVTRRLRQLDPAAPIHIHVAEQEKEVEDCLAFCGKRPVEWLLENAEIGPHWCLVHATHMTGTELRGLARSGAVAALCPTTEANLGDGLFNLPPYIREGGMFGIGSDSHISVNPLEELRLLEYGQRLLHKRRVIAKAPYELSNGAFLYRQALLGGARALARETGSIEKGKRGDLIAWDADNSALLGKSHEFLLDAAVFATSANPVRHVIVGGRHLVQDYRHVAEAAILSRYRQSLERLQVQWNKSSKTAAS